MNNDTRDLLSGMDAELIRVIIRETDYYLGTVLNHRKSIKPGTLAMAIIFYEEALTLLRLICNRSGSTLHEVQARLNQLRDVIAQLQTNQAEVACYA